MKSESQKSAKNHPEKSQSDFSELLRELKKHLKDTKHSFPDKLSLLHEFAREHQREQLSLPVETRVDFDLRLEQLFQAYDEGRFNYDSMETAARNLYSFIVSDKNAEKDEYLRGMTILYELNDMFNFAAGLSKEALDRAKPIYRELQKLQVEWSKSGNVSSDVRKLALQKVLYCACGTIELKRAGETKQAAKMFEWLLEFTSNSIADEKFPCLSTQATLAYQLGSLLRILEKHDRAETIFTEALAYLHAKAKQSPANVNVQLALVHKQAMVVGIGYGWVNYTRGFLRRAENALVTARALLETSKDPIIPWYIELLYGTILRCRAGTQKIKLEEARNSLDSARKAFEFRGHRRYAARARWELALAFNLANECEAAQEHLDFVAAYTDETGHPKWQTNIRVLQSRQFQKQGEYDNALNEAEVALTIANDYEALLPIVDAHLVRGEAKLTLAEEGIQKDKNLVDAISDFERAGNLISESNQRRQESSLPSNPKIVAVCELRIAQCLALMGDETAARTHLAHWQILGPNVEHEWVRELARNVTEKVKQLSLNFGLSSDDPKEWNYSASVSALREWLLRQALRKTGKNYSEAAKLIGVKRATLYQWQEDRKTKRARTKAD
jgi:tetratricopeptide (TPR) repeat protein